MSLCPLEEPHVAAFWALWYRMEVPGAGRVSTTLVPGGTGALLCIKLFISSFVGGWT